MKELIPFDVSDLYQIRLIVSLEDMPQSNKYHQVLLTPDQFHRISMIVGEKKKKEKDPDGVVHEHPIVPLSTISYTLPDQLKDFVPTK